MTIIARAVGLVILFLLGIAAWMHATQEFDPPPRLPAGLGSPVVALQLARSADDVQSVLRDPMGAQNRDVVRRLICEDWWFIVGYWACFSGLGLILRSCRWPGARLLGALTLAAAGTAALCDVFENLGVNLILDTEPAMLSDAMARTVRQAALAKWGALALVESALVPLFLAYGPRGHVAHLLCVLVGLALAVAALLGFGGLFCHPAIPCSTASLSFGLLAALPVLLLFPARFLRAVGVQNPWRRPRATTALTVALAAALLIAIVAATLVVRTLSVRASVDDVPPAADIQIDDRAAAARLLAAVRIRTISHRESTEKDHEPFRQLHAKLGAMFPAARERLQWETVDDNLLLTWKGSDTSLHPLLLLAHMDVVPAEAEGAALASVGESSDRAKWAERAFGADLKETDPDIYGRGTLDDKVSVVGILEAIEVLATQAFRPRRTIHLAFGCDEEVGGKNGALKLAKMLEERKISAECVIDEGSYVIEKADSSISFAIAPVGIAEKGYVDIELTARAEGGHSSMPGPHTAIGQLARAICRIEDNPFPARLDGLAQKTIAALRPELPFGPRLVLANEWLFGWLIESELSQSPTGSALIRTTGAVTIVQGGSKDNVLPDAASAIANFRPLPGDSSQRILNHVRRVVADPLVKIDFADPDKYSEVFEASKVSPIDTEAYETLPTTIRQTFPGAVVVPYLVTAGTDARHYERLAKNIYRFLPIRLTPLDLKRVHGVNEKISRKQFGEAIKFYYHLIKNFSE